MRVRGGWELLLSKPTLYTAKAADIIVHRPTGKRYIRGAYTFFKDEVPELVENTGEYDFYYITKDNKPTISTEQAITELYINSLLKK